MKRIQTEILVIGGGATGTGIAWDAALRGYQVVLVERRDLTHGTTGRYHGLLHSGGRYVVKDPQSAVECIAENRILRRTHAHCIEDTGGFFVVTPEDVGAYPDQFVAACAATGVPCNEISVQEALRREPLLNPRISRVFEVPDGAADSFLATHATAQAARMAGAQILTYHEVQDLIMAGGEGDRRVVGARVRDAAQDEDVEIHAQLVISATGAWANAVAHMAGIHLSVIPGKGTMVAMNHRMLNTVINRCKMPDDGDIIVPIHTVAVIGTTDQRVADPENLRIDSWEVQFMLEEGDKMIPGISKARVVRAWAGVRPLYQEDYAGDSRDATRQFALLDHKARHNVAGLITITGRQVDHLPPHGREDRGPGRPTSGRAQTLHHRPHPGPRRGPRAVLAGPSPPRSRGDPRPGPTGLRMRTGDPGHAGKRRPPEPHPHPGRPAPGRAPGHGTVPGRLLHLPGRGHPARDRPRRHLRGPGIRRTWIRLGRGHYAIAQTECGRHEPIFYPKKNPTNTGPKSSTPTCCCETFCRSAGRASPRFCGANN